MTITERDLELFAARIRPHFPPHQRDIAYELAYSIARAVGPTVKGLRPDTSLREILRWWNAERPLQDDSLDEVESIMAMEEEFGPSFVLPDEFAGRLDRTSFRELVEYVQKNRKRSGL